MSKVVAIVPWGDVIEDYLDPIGLTVADFAGQMTGGWLFGYVAALQSAGLSPIVLAPSRSQLAPGKLIHADTGVPIWLVPARSCQAIGSADARALSQWLTMPLAAVRRVLIAQGCEAILVQDYERPQFDMLVGLGRTMRIPVFGTFQGGDRTLSRVERLVRRSAIHNSARLVVAASAERARLASAYKLSVARIAPIPNPIDVADWSPLPRAAARASLGIDDKTFVAVTHGRIDIWRKGLDLLLAAWSGPGSLVLIGSGQDRERFAAMVTGRGDVRWIDHYSTDRMLIHRWLSAADVYISASRVEGMPVAPLEAMACGLPIIASTAQGLEDLFVPDLPPPGILFPNGDVAALSAAIETLRSDPALRRRFGANARAAAEQRFSIASVGRDLAGLLSPHRLR